MRFFYVTTVFAFLVTCNSKKSFERAVELNNQAVQLEDPDRDSSLVLLNMALEIHPDLNVAYTNKIRILHDLDRNVEALNTALVYSKSENFPIRHNLIVGVAYEHIQNLDLAKDYYKKALAYYQGNEWRNDPILSQIEYAMLITITRNREVGLKVFRRIISGVELSNDEETLIKRLENEIISYQGGGYLEFLESNDTIHFCFSKQDEDKIRVILDESNVNVDSELYHINSNLISISIKKKFVDKVEELGLKECD